MPTCWIDRAHRGALVKIWDNTHRPAGKDGSSVDAELAATKKRMLEVFPELKGGGIVPLKTEWVVYVLGTSNRPPFSTGKGMGRREILGASAGPRGQWGPF